MSDIIIQELEDREKLIHKGYKAVTNLLNGISTGAVRIDSDEDERLDNAIRQLKDFVKEVENDD